MNVLSTKIFGQHAVKTASLHPMNPEPNRSGAVEKYVEDGCASQFLPTVHGVTVLEGEGFVVMEGGVSVHAGGVGDDGAVKVSVNSIVIFGGEVGVGDVSEVASEMMLRE